MDKNDLRTIRRGINDAHRRFIVRDAIYYAFCIALPAAFLFFCPT